MMLWVGCIAGALEEQDYRAKLDRRRICRQSTSSLRASTTSRTRAQFLTQAGVDVDAIAPQVEGKFLSAFIRAVKPQTSCCEPGCCTPATATLKG